MPSANSGELRAASILALVSPTTQPRRPCPPARSAVSESAVFADQGAVEEKKGKAIFSYLEGRRRRGKKAMFTSGRGLRVWGR